MFEDYAESLLRSGIIEARAGQKEAARRYLDRALTAAHTHDVMSEGWYWMSRLTDEPNEKRKALENCLSLDLRHARARRELAILNGELKPEDVIDPDHLPPAPQGVRQASADRFMCPKCGGRMTFAPDGESLVCEYCARNQSLEAADRDAVEKDFVINMATVRGHSIPLQEQVFHCGGCGAEFFLPPTRISKACAYCGSPHVVKLEQVRELIAPNALLPHALNQKSATQRLIQWANPLRPRAFGGKGAEGMKKGFPISSGDRARATKCESRKGRSTGFTKTILRPRRR